VLGVVLAARSGMRSARKTAIPFGPFLAFGGLCGIFAGHAIVTAYLNAFT
jgi:leader peptidase (prepilin peptidase)/N-methyltransferase